MMATMLFDGDCGFCRRWIRRWREITRGAVRFVPYQEALASFPEVTEGQCEHAVQLIFPDHRVYSGAHAVFKVLTLGGGYSWALRLYERFPPFRWMAELLYGIVARHRPFFSRFA
jgi:predicted DCC family thiol-disulfide oxidoreductase YuxK